MLDFTPTSLEKERFDSTTRVRHGVSFGALIQRASASMGVDKSVFIRAAAEREAERVLAAQSVHVMTLEDVEAFEAALDTAPVPTPRALAAARYYRTRVVHAD